MTTLPVEAIRNLLDGPHRGTFKALLNQYYNELLPLYLETLKQLQAAPDDAARREIVTAVTEKLKAWIADTPAQAPAPPPIPKRILL